MRKLLPHVSFVALSLVVFGLFSIPHLANAQGVVGAALSLLTGGVDIFYGLIGKIFWWILIPATSWVVWLIGQMIDYVTTLSLTSTFYSSEAINAGWMIIRDLCNMIFIFVLIYTGLSTVLNVGNAVVIRKMITNVVIAALLINFSLFITKVVIDVSNVGTSWFVQGVQNIGGGQGISYSVQGALQMSKLAENKNFGSSAFTLASFVTGIALFVLNCVAIYVFFKVAFFLIARLVAFMFLLITSPLGFIGHLGVPQLSTYSKKWWAELQAQALMAPMFFLMLYLTLFIVDRVDVLVFGTSAGQIDPVTGSSFSPANYVMFGIIIMMLLKCLDTAKEYSGELGGKIADYLKSASGIALGGMTAGLGAIGRQSVGRAAFAYTQNKEKMASLQATASESSLRGIGARMALATVNKGATSSFDARASKIGGGVIGSLDPKLDIPVLGKIDAGKVGKTEEGGFKAGTEEFKKSEKEWAEKNLGKGAAGETNRLRYAQEMQKSSINNYVLNPGIRYKDVYEDLNKAAKEGLTKTVKEDSKKKAAAKQNQVVMAETVQAVLKKSTLSSNPKDVEKVASTGQMLISELKTELKKENEENYLKYVRSFDTYRNKSSKEETEKLSALSDSIEKLRDQAQFLMKDPEANKVEIGKIEQEIKSKSTQRDGLNQEMRDNDVKFRELEKSITSEDRKKASEKFSELSQKDWEEARKKHLNSISEITERIKAAEGALALALNRDLDLEAKKTKVAEAERKITDLIGKSPKYAGKGKNKKQIEKGSGLKQQAADLKDKFNEKNNELRVEEKEEEGDEKEDEKKSEEGTK